MHTKPSNTTPPDRGIDKAALAGKIKRWGKELGFSAIGIARADVSRASGRLDYWLELGRHGEMDYMVKHRELRAAPAALVPETISVISARMPYWPQAASSEQVLADGEIAYISRYALGRDYHHKVRHHLMRLAKRIETALAENHPASPFVYRVFSDSAPVMEVEFAVQAGIAWRGKHTLALSRDGSWNFLGEIYTSLDLPVDAASDGHCGTCSRCIEACPTGAIVAPYEIDANSCISYLTIELKGTIPLPLRPSIGNRIYGCDDCQLCCPWNRFARIGDTDFAVRNGLDEAKLVDLFAWDAREFETLLAGSPIRRIGHERWLRNVAVALGNAPPAKEIETALLARSGHPSTLVREHVAWALSRIAGARTSNSDHRCADATLPAYSSPRRK
jgi:epoxyqueuosine reductase